MSFWIKKTAKKITVYGSGSLLMLIALLVGLDQYITVTGSGDIFCAGSIPCVSYINITNEGPLNVSFSSKLAWITFDNNTYANYSLYKLDASGRWKSFNITGKTIHQHETWQLKIVGYKEAGAPTFIKVGTGYIEILIKWLDPPTQTTLYINSTSADRNIELGEPVNITGVVNVTGLQVCLSINHTDLGENFTCGTTSVTYIWSPTASTNKFNSTTAMNLSYSSLTNQTITVRLHSYDVVNSAMINLTGVNTTYPENYPNNVRIFINDSLSNVITGTLKEGISTLNTLSDGSTAKNLTLASAGSQMVYLTLPKNVVVTDAKLNLSGYKNVYWGNVSPIYTSESLLYSISPGIAVPGLIAMEVKQNISNNTVVDITYYLAEIMSNTNIVFNYSIYITDNFTVAYNQTTISSSISRLSTDPQTLSGGNWEAHKYRTSVTTNKTITDGNFFLIIASDLDNNVTTPSVTFSTAGVQPFAGRQIDSSTAAYYLYRYAGTDYFLNYTDTDDFVIMLEWKYPENPYLDVEGDGDAEWSYSGELNNSVSPKTTGNFSDSLNHYLSLCTADSYGNCNVPLVVGSSSAGKIQISAINIKYRVYFNPLTLNKDYIQSYLNNSPYGYVDVPIKIEANQGNVSVSGLKVNYNGSAVFNVTAFYVGNATYSASSNTRFINLSYSRFVRNLPYIFTEQVIFLPKTNSSKNVTPYGQTNTIPIFNITWKNYEKNASLAIRVNETPPACVVFTASNTSNKDDGFVLDTTFKQIYYNRPYNSANMTNIWLWADFNNCNATEMKTYIKRFELKSCCVGCMQCW